MIPLNFNAPHLATAAGLVVAVGCIAILKLGESLGARKERDRAERERREHLRAAAPRRWVG